MKQPDAPCRIDSLQIMEASIVNKPDNMVMTADYVLLGSTAQPGLGQARAVMHGKNTAYTHNWSKRTLELVHQLFDSMETDLTPQHFDMEVADTREEENVEQGIEPGGLEEAPQI